MGSIALIFDFDDTLTDDSTTALLKKYKIDPQEFWRVKVQKRVEAGWDPSLAYLAEFLDNVGKGRPLGELKNEDLFEFGKTLKPYVGLPGLFNDLKEIVEQHNKEHRKARADIEFYVISGGFEQVIRGSPIAQYLDGFWGCRLAEDSKSGHVAYVMNTVTFTEKTKYLFVINKGLNDEIKKNPYAVNEDVADADRPISFENMIYVGDGLTDIPCFSLIKSRKGTAFAVFKPEDEDSARRAYEKLLTPKRALNLNPPAYGRKDALGVLLRAAVKSICLRLGARAGGV